MGTEISQSDLNSILGLADLIHSISEYRTKLHYDICSRMHAIAPNLTTLVGGLVGARLMALAGTLDNLVKQPVSTIQLLSADVHLPHPANPDFPQSMG
jgi:nucleolar protein 58